MPLGYALPACRPAPRSWTPSPTFTREQTCQVMLRPHVCMVLTLCPCITCVQIGAEELDPESYRTSLELRGQLQEAARVRGVLEAALRTLQNQLRPEDAEALERALQVRAEALCLSSDQPSFCGVRVGMKWLRTALPYVVSWVSWVKRGAHELMACNGSPCALALQEAGKWEELLAPDLAKARKALEQWRCMSVSDAKLARLLREGASTAVLARAIQVGRRLVTCCAPVKAGCVR